MAANTRAGGRNVQVPASNGARRRPPIIVQLFAGACLLIAFFWLFSGGGAKSLLTSAAPLSLALERASLMVAWIRSFIAHAPALSIGVTFVFAALPLAIVTMIARRLFAGRGASGEDLRLALAATSSTAADDTVAVTGFSRPRRAWLEYAHEPGTPGVALGGGLVRIGSAADNDLVMSSAGVERYHAAVNRTREHDTYVNDLTGSAKGAIKVNGRRTRCARLRNGDVIVIAGVKLIYRTSKA
ncbi:MAG: FHA domain-containing protein [Hyphomicrobiaceae bacterium]|nr:FHA domain-containing protein [Hyphomicrobiaceae bacterium]